MAKIWESMMTKDSLPVKCREARRRRIEIRRYSTMSTSGSTSAPSESRNKKEKRGENPNKPDGGKRNRGAVLKSDERSTSPSSSSSGDGAPPVLTSEMTAATSGNAPMSEAAVICGSISVSGRSREMEDAVAVKPNFCRPVISGRKPLHFFAVYDGHGGSHVATLCKERMHVLLGEELMKEPDERSGSESVPQEQALKEEDDLQEKWRRAMERSFERMDEVALAACACGRIGGRCGCERAGLSSEIVGSTAVIAVVTPDRLLVANCGDSRAVLSRGGRAIPLSSDHKPDRPDELERIEAAGGRVIFLNGARVLGILAMSRALGDKYLKPIVISQPEISFTNRTPEDECLILASDGLWDVLSNDIACDIARRCLLESSNPPSSVDLNTVPNTTGGVSEENVSGHLQQSQYRCSLAAALLTRLALGRKSTDNISVIVIDLKRSWGE